MPVHAEEAALDLTLDVVGELAAGALEKPCDGLVGLALPTFEHGIERAPQQAGLRGGRSFADFSAGKAEGNQ